MNGKQNQQQYQKNPNDPQYWGQEQYYQTQQPPAQPKKKKKKWIPWVVGTGAVIILISAMGGGGGNSQSATVPNAASTSAPANVGPAIEVSAGSMVQELQTNALKAKQTYEGKRVTVSGGVGVIDASGKYFTVEPNDGSITLIGIRANLDTDAQKSQLANLTKGENVAVTGTVTSVGEIMGYSIDIESIN